MSLLEFVTFHVSLGDERVHPNKTLAHREYLDMIKLMSASASLFHPKSQCCVLTDASTDLSLLPRSIRVERAEMDKTKVMMERTRLQLAHLERSELRSPMVLLDSDILVNAPLDSIFERDFDIALTWRAHPPVMPINGGVMIINNRRPEVSKQFFRRFWGIYESQHANGEEAAWFGDQLALRDAVGLPAEAYAEADIVDCNGCKVLLLPCDTHNFSPTNRYREIALPLEGKVILHFKGERKRLMQPYWRAWLNPQRGFTPLTRYQGHKAREWLEQQIEIEASAV